jgi:hypothetical protein
MVRREQQQGVSGDSDRTVEVKNHLACAWDVERTGGLCGLRRVAWHWKLGWFAVGWACLMAVMGPWGAHPRSGDGVGAAIHRGEWPVPEQPRG